MSTKHTPGPWDLDTVTDIIADVPEFNGYVEGISDGDENVTVANARLIAAAPDLLAALKAALSAIETGELDDWAAFNDLAIAAIAKAQGEQQ